MDETFDNFSTMELAPIRVPLEAPPLTINPRYDPNAIQRYQKIQKLNDLYYNEYPEKNKQFNKKVKRAKRTFWWNSQDTEDTQMQEATQAGQDLLKVQQEYNDLSKELGLEGIAPKLEDYSQETMTKTLDKTAETSAANRAESLNKTYEYAGLAFDTARSLFNDNRSVYDGKHGGVAQGLDTAGDSFSNAAMASGNPYAMMAGAAYKGMSLLNQVIGGGTDGMTKKDAFLDSNLGFALTGGLSKLNGALGMTTDKFEVDNDLRAAMGSSYLDTYGDLEDAESKAGKRYGYLSRGAGRQAQNEVRMAEQRQSMLSDINETAQDRIAAGGYEGIGFRNQMNLNGGFRTMRAARKGLKMNLDFAHKVAKAQRGIRFNVFDMVEQPSVAPDAVQSPALVPPILDIESSLNPQEPVTERDFEKLGVVFKEIDDQGRLVYEAPWGVGDLLGKNQRLIDNLIKKYKANGVVFNSVRQSEALNVPSQQNNQGSGQGNNQGSNQSGQQGSPSSPSAEELDSGWQIDMEVQKKKDMIETLNSLLGNYDGTREQIIDLAIKMILNHFPEIPLEEAYAAAEKWYEHYHKNGKYTNKQGTPEGDGEFTPIEGSTQVEVNRNGGVFTFTPYTDEQVNKFKAGGSFNVIPDGALHKNRHNMEGAEGLTKKGIPVVTEEDGKKVQQAEIEVNEIIFRLEVTEKLEKLAKEGTDEAALEAGKLITEEILHNTHDNTGLIKETV